jgi:hypothetical protein
MSTIEISEESLNGLRLLLEQRLDDLIRCRLERNDYWDCLKMARVEITKLKQEIEELQNEKHTYHYSGRSSD